MEADGRGGCLMGLGCHSECFLAMEQHVPQGVSWLLKLEPDLGENIGLCYGCGCDYIFILLGT